MEKATKLQYMIGMEVGNEYKIQFFQRHARLHHPARHAKAAIYDNAASAECQQHRCGIRAAGADRWAALTAQNDKMIVHRNNALKKAPLR
ncbi:hypothetical protein RvVAR031_20450 [Agrobacterium vitis]|nr:hypothetical protein RvVAR031_20450 [Agrobacterium vitis]